MTKSKNKYYKKIINKQKKKKNLIYNVGVQRKRLKYE